MVMASGIAMIILLSFISIKWMGSRHHFPDILNIRTMVQAENFVPHHWEDDCHLLVVEGDTLACRYSRNEHTATLVVKHLHITFSKPRTLLTINFLDGKAVKWTQGRTVHDNPEFWTNAVLADIESPVRNIFESGAVGLEALAARWDHKRN